jgi:hypothetical protein
MHSTGKTFEIARATWKARRNFMKLLATLD